MNDDPPPGTAPGPSQVSKSSVPKDTIIENAEGWNTDSIFVGPHFSGNSFQRFLLGSVSAAVAARAHCSGEVVRKIN